jgi:hypothetical protein
MREDQCVCQVDCTSRLTRPADRLILALYPCCSSKQHPYMWERSRPPTRRFPPDPLHMCIVPRCFANGARFRPRERHVEDKVPVSLEGIPRCGATIGHSRRTSGGSSPRGLRPPSATSRSTTCPATGGVWVGRPCGDCARRGAHRPRRVLEGITRRREAVKPRPRPRGAERSVGADPTTDRRCRAGLQSKDVVPVYVRDPAQRGPHRPHPSHERRAQG